MEKNNNFAILALVAIVAVVGIIALIMVAGGNGAATTDDVPVLIVDEAGNVVGQAGLRATAEMSVSNAVIATAEDIYGAIPK